MDIPVSHSQQSPKEVEFLPCLLLLKSVIKPGVKGAMNSCQDMFVGDY